MYHNENYESKKISKCIINGETLEFDWWNSKEKSFDQGKSIFLGYGEVIQINGKKITKENMSNPFGYFYANYSTKVPNKIKFNNCYIYASEQTYNLLIDLGFEPDSSNTKELGIAWNGCYLLKDGVINAQGSSEYHFMLSDKYTEIYYDDRKNCWFKKVLEKF